MSSLVKTLLREVALRTPHVRDRFLEWEFRRRKQSFRGIYDTFADAALAAPTGPLVGYNHKEIALVAEHQLDSLHQGDYPVLFWLAPMIGQATRLFDLGGNIGIAYYVYRHYLTYPRELRWTVCDVPATVEAGRNLAAQKSESALRFTTDRAEADGCDIYFTAGALQYIEEPFADIIARLPRRPRHILLNRVPLWDRERFITLQNNGAWTVPYKIDNREQFAQSLIALGYNLIDHWRNSRTLQVLTSPEHLVENYHGMYFRLDESNERSA